MKKHTQEELAELKNKSVFLKIEENISKEEFDKMMWWHIDNLEKFKKGELTQEQLDKLDDFDWKKETEIMLVLLKEEFAAA